MILTNDHPISREVLVKAHSRQIFSHVFRMLRERVELRYKIVYIRFVRGGPLKRFYQQNRSILKSMFLIHYKTLLLLFISFRHRPRTLRQIPSM